MPLPSEQQSIFVQALKCLREADNHLQGILQREDDKPNQNY
jgi:hypothetical protein